MSLAVSEDLACRTKKFKPVNQCRVLLLMDTSAYYSPLYSLNSQAMNWSLGTKREVIQPWKCFGLYTCMHFSNCFIWMHVLFKLKLDYIAYIEMCDQMRNTCVWPEIQPIIKCIIFILSCQNENYLCTCNDSNINFQHFANYILFIQIFNTLQPCTFH